MPIGRESIVVDCDVTPYIPDGWSVVEHTPRGQIEFAPGKIQLYLTDSQRQGLQPQGRGLVVRTDGEVHDERLPAGLPAGEQGAHSLDLEGGGGMSTFPPRSTVTPTALCASVVCIGTTVSGTGTTTGSTTTGTIRTLPLSSPVSSFLTRLTAGGGLFFKLSVPTSEHPSDFVQFFG